ncbi:MAG: spermidine/putrescine ABC transporter substrate-binding protein [Oscillospiraceae bacterium]|nr:spermidine/putrescine ABC transporter substrate-binding protein [Oscillospiraceae bacterium]
MKMKITIAVLLCLAILVGLFLFVHAGQDDLRVFNWGEYIDESILKQFTEETGIKINYKKYASNEEMYAKLKRGGSRYDIIVPTDYMIERMIAEDMLEKLDFGNIPNFGNIDSRFTHRVYDPGSEYSVPYMWGTNGLIYNTEMVHGEIDSWDVLWDETYKGQILMYDSMRDSFIPALIKLGYSINTRSPRELEEARDLLIAQKPLVHAYMGDIMRDSMISGEAAIGLMFSGDAVYCIDENPALAYVIPKEGSNVWFDAVAIPKGARNKEAAELFINFLCRPDIALKNTEYIGFSTVNAEAFKMLPPELLENPAYWPPDEAIDRCELLMDLGDFAGEFDRAWTMVLAK